ncbi:MAG: tetraacyldisaccharide 4'-kinase, partial [Planctomycetes bacterium]|nr:tetraacyldisaccharide 4'-kinase [Planctomycetota bacterium]
MSYEQSYKKLISGKSSGLGAAVLRLLLAAAAQIYKIIIAIRNQLYDKNILKSYRVNAAVISVGNITAGGTGKTPLVISLCNKINLNYKCAILTRGYKTQATKTDEPAVLAENCPQAKVVINPNRVEAANLTINKFGANVLIMDDGFQHRRLKRDLDIVTIDATCPFGFGKII